MLINSLLKSLKEVYSELDGKTSSLELLHKNLLHCKCKCTDCCVDDLTVFEIEAEYIQQNHGALLNFESPHSSGACAFLDEKGACRIYSIRPYVCRTQGLPLRWIDERDNGSIVEMRDICSLNESDTPVEILPEEECWTIGPFEAKLATLQVQLDKGKMRRVFLRSLFKRGFGDVVDLPKG